MNITNKDFISIYENSLSKENCDFIIQEFEKHASINPSSISDGDKQFGTQEMGRLDFSLFAERLLPDVSKIINQTLDNCLHFYTEEFFSLKQVKARSEWIKLQRTPPKGGYHVWHSEVNSRRNMDRVLTWIIYLNDIPEGEGETEFLWQGIRVKPKAGTCVIWPAQFTHPHRGNPVYSCDKYIATGWYTYTD
jgi:hypothetical protein